MQRALCMFILGHLTHLHLHVLQNQLKCLCTTSRSEVNVVTVHDYRRTHSCALSFSFWALGIHNACASHPVKRSEALQIQRQRRAFISPLGWHALLRLRCRSLCPSASALRPGEMSTRPRGQALPEKKKITTNIKIKSDISK